MADTPSTVAAPAAAPPAWWRAVKTVLFFAAAALAAWAVFGKTDELTGASGYLNHLEWEWAAFAALAELVSYVAYAAMQRRLLRAGGVEVRLSPMTSVTLAGNAIQNSLPAGVVLSAAYAFRQYRRFGAGDVLSGWVVVAMTVLSLMSLSALAAAGLALAATTGNALDLVSVIVGLACVMGLLVILWHRREWLLAHAPSVVRFCQRLIHRPRGDADRLVHDAVARVSAISPSRRDWAVAGAMAAFNWIFDLGCLIMAFLAVDAHIPWGGVLLAYAAAQLAANLPVTPGGLGVVEGSLTIALVAFGGAKASTVAAVLVYRLFNFWAMLPLGWAAWGLLALQSRRERRSRPEPLPATQLPATPQPAAAPVPTVPAAAVPPSQLPSP